MSSGGFDNAKEIKKALNSRSNKRANKIIDYKNQDIYSFGGTTHINKAYTTTKKSPLGQMDAGDEFYFGTYLKKPETNIIYRNEAERVNDYTKNISQNIFNPGINNKNPLKRANSASRIQRPQPKIYQNIMTNGGNDHHHFQ